MLGAFNFNGCDKLEKNSFKNILAMKILVLYSSLTVPIALQLTSAWTPSGFFKNSYLAVQGSSKKKGNHLTDDGENEERKKKN